MAEANHKGTASSSTYNDLIGKSDGFLEDYCMSFARGNSSCDTIRSVILDDGRLAVPYSPHTVDVSTLQFQDY